MEEHVHVYGNSVVVRHKHEKANEPHVHAGAEEGLHFHAVDGKTIAHSHTGTFKQHGVEDDHDADAGPTLTSSTRVNIIVAIGSVGLIMALFGIGCTSQMQMCPAGNSVGMPLIIVGGATAFVVAIYAFFVVKSDRHSSVNAREEKTPLIKSSDGAVPIKIIAALYTSDFLASWGDRMWQFAVPMLFMEVFVDTLLPSAVFGVVVYLGCVFGMPSIGKWVDANPRLQVYTSALIIENTCIVLSSLLIVIIMVTIRPDGVHPAPWTPLLTVLFIGINLLAIVGQMMNQAQNICLSRDWIVVVARGDSGVLAMLNTSMRRIDLGTTILSLPSLSPLSPSLLSALSLNSLSSLLSPPCAGSI
jgi:iron-regulated transporter 1